MKGWRDVVISQHAVERYIQRIAPGTNRSEAEATLRRKLIDARRSGKAIGGGELWQVLSPAAFLVISQSGPRPVVTTVLMTSQVRESTSADIAQAPELPSIEVPAEPLEPRSMLLEYWDALGPQGQRVFLMVGRRLALGAERYGDFPIRKWTKEAAEEALDMAVYLAAELLKEEE